MQIKQRPSAVMRRSSDEAAGQSAQKGIPNSAMLAMVEAGPIRAEELSALPGTEHTPTDSLKEELQSRLGVRMPGLRIFEDQGLKEQFDQRAYARGNEIHVAKGEYSPNTGSGMELLMHEAAHIVQQGSGMAGGSGILADSGLEAQAHEGFAAPDSFSMPTTAEGSPIQGWNPFRRRQKPVKPTKEELIDRFNEYEDEFLVMSEEEQRRWVKSSGIKPKKARKKKTDTDIRQGHLEKFEGTRNIANVAGNYALSDAYAQGVIQQNEEDTPGWTGKKRVKFSPLMGMLGGVAIEKLGKGGNKAMIGGGLAGAAGMAVGAASNATSAVYSGKKGNVSDAVASGIGAAGNTLMALGGLAKAGAAIAGATDALSMITNTVVPGIGLLSGAGQMVGGSIRLGSAVKHRHQLKKDMEALATDSRRAQIIADNPVGDTAQATEETRRQNLRLARNATFFKAAKQVRSMEQVRAMEGGMEIAGGAMLAGGNLADMSGVGAPIGILGKLGAVVTGFAKGIVGGIMKKYKRGNMLDEELSFRQKRAALMAANPKLKKKQAEQLAFKSMGFESGTREEAFAKVTMSRASQLHEAAQSGDETAQRIVKHMGIKRIRGNYSLQGIAEKMGLSSTSPWQKQMTANKPAPAAANPFRQHVPIEDADGEIEELLRERQMQQAVLRIPAAPTPPPLPGESEEIVDIDDDIEQIVEELKKKGKK